MAHPRPLGRVAVALATLLTLGACAGDGGRPGVGRAAAGLGRPEPVALPSTTSTTAAPITTTTTAPPRRRSELLAHDDTNVDRLAATIVTAERVIRDPDRSSAEAVAEGHTSQLAYKVVGRHPELSAAVLARIPADLRDVAGSNIHATVRLRAMMTRLRETLPAWRIVRPADPDTLLGHYRAAEREFGVPWTVLAGINLVETRMGRIRGTSVAGAQGPMQFMPRTWEAFGEGDVNDDRDAIRAAARYLRHNGGNDPARLRGAVWNYNHDDRYVDAVLAYSDVMAADPLAYRGYWGWEVYYATTAGDVLLAEGYEEHSSVPVEEWLTRP